MKRPTSTQMKPVVLSVGSLVPVKGFLYLIEAMPLVLAKVDCQFVIAGSGPERARITNLAIELGVSQSLSMIGIVATEGIPGLMRQADVFVLPSAPHESGDDESLGMVLAEASASGTPCVATKTGGISDIVVDGVNGILVRPGSSPELAQAILELISDPDRREEMGRSGRRLVEARFSVSTVALKTKSVYESLVSA